MKTLRAFIAGLVVGIMLLSSVAVFADTQTIEVFFNNIKISIDGKVIELKDATGNPVQPFIYNGTTNAPIRAIAEALGMEVKLNEITNTLELSKKAGEEPMLTPDVSTENFHDENILLTTLSDEITYINIKDIMLDKTLRFDGYIKAVPNKNSDTVNIYKFTKNNGAIILENIPVVTSNANCYIPYDTYKNDILPKLLEAIKQNQ
jgi:hypothetical protein